MSRTAESTGDFDAVSCVLGTLRAGEPVLAHDFDDREGRTDLAYPVDTVGSTDVVRMCNDAGGLVCVALPSDTSKSLGLPFVDDVLDHPVAPSHDLTYDLRSSFPLTVSHRGSSTGTTNRGYAMIISWSVSVTEAARAGKYDADDFGGEFRTPGHVHLLRGAPNLLSDRQSHTELGPALANEADISSAVAVYEMLDDEADVVLPKGVARNYADRYGLAFIDDDDPTDELV